MNLGELLQSNQFEEALAECKRLLAIDPNDGAALRTMASAFIALKQYKEAIPLFERLGERDRACKATPGDPGPIYEIASIYWFMEEHAKAIELMHEQTAGLLKGKIKYSKGGAGLAEGLLLYYMAITDKQPDEASYALDYLKKCRKRTYANGWPYLMVQYHLDEITYEDIIKSIEKK